MEKIQRSMVWACMAGRNDMVIQIRQSPSEGALTAMKHSCSVDVATINGPYCSGVPFPSQPLISLGLTGGEIMWLCGLNLNQSPQYQAWSVSLGPRKAAGQPE